MREALAAKREAEIQGMFGRIAHRYDLLNRVLSLGQDVRWRRALALRVGAAAPQLVLDACAGTGDVALALSPRVLSVASDFSLPMLARARGKAVARGRRLPLFAADALRLPLAEGSVDVVTVAFGVRNFESLDRGLGELLRVLRVGGTLLILEFSHPEGMLAPLLSWWVRNVPPRLGRWISGDREAYAYLPESVSTFPKRQEMCERLVELELDAVCARRLTGGVATLYEATKRRSSLDTAGMET